MVVVGFWVEVVDSFVVAVVVLVVGIVVNLGSTIVNDAFHLGCPVVAIFIKALLLSVLKITVITLVEDTTVAGIWAPLRKDSKGFDDPSKTLIQQRQLRFLEIQLNFQKILTEM